MENKNYGKMSSRDNKKRGKILFINIEKLLPVKKTGYHLK